MAKLDKKELLGLMKLKADNADLYLARITQEKIEEVKSIIENLKLQKGDDGHTPTEEELIELIRPLIPEPIKGEDAEPITDEQLLALIKPLIPEAVDGEDGEDGQDYFLTEQDLVDIAALVEVEVPEVKEMTVERLTELLKGIQEGDKVLDVSNIAGLEDKIRKIEQLSGRGIGGVGKRTTLLSQLVDVDLSKLDIVDDKYVLGSGTVKSVTAGENIEVDNTDPDNPVISADIPPSIIQDTRVNIFALTGIENGQFAYATDYDELFIYRDGWQQADTLFTERTGAVDMGVYQDSSPTGYGRDYVDRKHLSNATIGANVEEKEGGIRTVNSQSLGRRIAQFYLNGAWQTALTGVNIQTDSNETPPDIEFTDFSPWILSLISGNSDVKDSSGIPVVQNMKVDAGAYQTPLIIDGGNF